MFDINEVAKRIAFANNEKGFTFTEREVDQKLMLVISELAEAQEELRDGKDINDIYYQVKDPSLSAVIVYAPHEKHEIPSGVIGKPCGFPVEIADAAIRLMHIAANFDLKIEISNLPFESEFELYDSYLLEICRAICQMQGYNPREESDFKIYLDEAITLIFKLSEKYNIDLEEVIEEKLAYNATRPMKHGRQF